MCGRLNSAHGHFNNIDRQMLISYKNPFLGENSRGFNFQQFSISFFNVKIKTFYWARKLSINPSHFPEKYLTVFKISLWYRHFKMFYRHSRQNVVIFTTEKDQFKNYFKNLSHKRSTLLFLQNISTYSFKFTYPCNLQV